MKNNPTELLSQNVAQTVEYGRTLGRSLQGGEVIALIGELGTGKTHLIKGIAEGLDIEDAHQVTSPTFTLINEYQGRLFLYHIDAYRLEQSRQLESLGFDELVSPDSVVVVEWADRVQNLVDAFQPIHIFLEHQGATKRKIRIENLPHLGIHPIR